MSWIQQWVMMAQKISRWKAFQVDTWWTLITNLVSYWKMEDATDYYWSNNWSIVWSPTFTTWKVNNAVTLNWTSQYITIPDNINLTPTNFSINLWVKTSSTAREAIFVKRDAVQWYLLEMNCWTSWDIQFDILDTADRYSRSTNASLNNNAWHMITITANHLNNINIYKDNVEVTYLVHQTWWFINNNTASVLNIWATTPASEYLAWQVDETWFWNKILTAQEITDLYNSGNWQTLI